MIGGGFAGSCIARSLEKVYDIEVTLIDSKEYFEFTPGILRTIVDPTHVKKIQICHKDYLKKSKIIIGDVTEISKKEVTVNKKKIKFDYLAICSGSDYSSPIKDKDVIVATRSKHLSDNYNKLCKAKKVLIVGGGLVGVELAAEILDHYDDKEITLVHSGKNIMARNHERSASYAESFLENRGVKILRDLKMTRKSGKSKYLTNNKKKSIEADIAFLCTGIIPQYKFMKKNFKKSLNKNNQIEVNEFLQVKGQENIFAAGDITSVVEEKTAQNAQRQSDIVVKNILRLDSKEKLNKYKSKKTTLVISLGKSKGIFESKDMVITGGIPSFMKRFIEWKEMFKFKIY